MLTLHQTHYVTNSVTANPKYAVPVSEYKMFAVWPPDNVAPGRPGSNPSARLTVWVINIRSSVSIDERQFSAVRGKSRVSVDTRRGNQGWGLPGCREPVYAPLLNRPLPCQVDEDSGAG